MQISLLWTRQVACSADCTHTADVGCSGGGGGLAVPGRLIGQAQLLSKASAAGPDTGVHDVALRPAAVLKQVAGGQHAQQAAGLGEGDAAHAQQLSGCSPLKGAREQREQQQGMQEVIWKRTHNEANAPEETLQTLMHRCSCAMS